MGFFPSPGGRSRQMQPEAKRAELTAPGQNFFNCLLLLSWVRKIPWRRAWQPSPVLLSGESHGQRSLAGYSAWGRKELDTPE